VVRGRPIVFTDRYPHSIPRPALCQRGIEALVVPMAACRPRAVGMGNRYSVQYHFGDRVFVMSCQYCRHERQDAANGARENMKQRIKGATVV